MEEGNPMIIFAGYENRIEEFLKINSGLSSRISKRFKFPNYTTSEMAEMFFKQAEKQASDWSSVRKGPAE